MRAIPFSTNKGYTLQSAGSNPGQWGAGAADSLNTALVEYLDINMGGIQTFSGLTNANVSLTQGQARNCCYRLTGTPTGSITFGPALGVLMIGFYYIENLTTGNFSVTFTTPAGSCALPQGRNLVCFVDAVFGPRVMAIAGATSVTSTADPIPSGATMIFAQLNAPTGWTAESLTNYGLRVVNAGTTGGTTFGSVDYSTLFTTQNVGNTTLTTDQIPSHSHPVKYNTITSLTQTGSATATQAITGAGANTAATEVTGGGNPHTHALDMRVKTKDVVLAARN